MRLMADEPRPADSRFVDANHRWPVFRSLASYRASFLTRDLVAGLTLVAVAIPEQMATARLGGFSPEVGFFAFVAGSLAFALFGDNRLLSCGADSTITPIFAGSLALLAASGSADYTALGAMLALMVGIVLVAGGIFRLGWIADLLSIPVTTGFLAGISVHILYLPIADRPWTAIARRHDAPARRDPRRPLERSEPFYPSHRFRSPGRRRPIRTDQRTHSGCIDRARPGDHGRCADGT